MGKPHRGLPTTENERSMSKQDVKALYNLPLFAECVHCLAMIKQAITVVMKAVQHLNPGQTAVVAFDQRLY